MLQSELTPAEREAWEELRDAERALELAQLRWLAVTEGPRRRLHLRLVEPISGERNANR